MTMSKEETTEAIPKINDKTSRYKTNSEVLKPSFVVNVDENKRSKANLP